MTEQQSLATMRNFLFQLENGIKYRLSNGGIVEVSEYMIPEALRTVVELAQVGLGTKVVDDCIKENPNQKSDTTK